GMDFIMDYRLVYCLQHGLPLDQDVYDAAEWSCIGALTAMSLEHNSVPVAVPDFTRGDWNKTDGYRHAMLVQ
ncbi:MAG TPA: glycosyl hydrolase, partial [Alistipes sp.]|nr:glycosyl hydrolase [Alistipes sp.]